MIPKLSEATILHHATAQFLSAELSASDRHQWQRNLKTWRTEVIENARRRAESIMNEGKGQYYYHAVNWLHKVRAAYIQLGQLEERKHYRTTLMQTHARKRKLVSRSAERET